MTVGELILASVWFLIPPAVANTVPVLVRRIPFLGTPIDGGRTWRSEPLLGANKTWRGLLAAPLAGWFVFWSQQQLGIEPDLAFTAGATAPAWWGAVLGGGAILGDLVPRHSGFDRLKGG